MINAMKPIAWVAVLLASRTLHAQSSSVLHYEPAVNSVVGQDWYVANQSALAAKWKVACTSPPANSTVFFFDVSWQRIGDDHVIASSTGSVFVPADTTVFYWISSTHISEEPFWGTEYQSFVEVLPTQELDYSGYFWPDVY